MNKFYLQYYFCDWQQTRYKPCLPATVNPLHLLSETGYNRHSELSSSNGGPRSHCTNSLIKANVCVMGEITPGG